MTSDVVQTSQPRRRPAPVGRSTMARIRNVPYYFVVPVVLIAGWWLAYKLELMPEYLLPAPSRVFFDTLPRALTEGAPGIDGNLVAHSGHSLARVAAGLLLASLTAIPLGILLGFWPRVSPWFTTVINGGRSLPPSALVPIAILWFGIGDQPALFLIWFASFWAILLNTITAVSEVDVVLVDSARTMGASTMSVVRTVVLPGALPGIGVGIRVGFGLGWSAVVTAELLAVRSGLGFFIWQSRQLFMMDAILAGVIVVGVLGVLIDTLLQRVTDYLFRWQRNVTI